MDRPIVIVRATASVDGRLTTAPGALLLHGDERWNALAAADADAYERLQRRYSPQAILEGSGSFVVEGTEAEPLPEAEGDVGALYADYLPGDVVEREGRRWFVAVDGRGRVRGWMKEWPDALWAGWHLLVLVSRSTPAGYLAYLRRESIPYLVQGEERVDLRRALEKLAERLGVATAVSTAGGRLNGALLRAGLVDEVDLTFFPALIGGTNTPSLFDGADLGPDERPARLKLLSAEVDADGWLRLRYRVLADGD